MPILLTGKFNPSAGPGAFKLYDITDLDVGTLDKVMTLIAGGRVTANGILGEIVPQTGAGVPVHSASEGVVYWDTTNNNLYANNNGSTGWTLLGSAASVTVVSDALAAHIADTTAAHAASAIEYLGGPGLSAINVETALDELAIEKGDIVPSLNDFRFTATSGEPVLLGDVTTVSTIYLSPYKGKKIALYVASVWTQVTSAEISLALSGLTSDKGYDVFAYSNAGVLTLELSAAWTNDTTRADALAQQDGVWVKSNDHSRRHVGCFYSTSTTATTDVMQYRYMWNRDNQTFRTAYYAEATSHTSASVTYTEWRNGTGGPHRCHFMLGDGCTIIGILAMDLTGGNAGGIAQGGVGIDTVTSVFSPSVLNASSSRVRVTNSAPLPFSGPGKFYVAILEQVTAGTQTFDVAYLTCFLFN